MKLTRLSREMKKLGLQANCLAVLCLSAPAWAQGDAAGPDVQTVTVTGSNIKQIQNEGALPVQVIRRAEIDRQGITSAEQLLTMVSANAAGAYNMTANQAEGFTASTGTHNSGASSANLRGLGADSTLVLLNGRRIATHGLNGSSVDLNSIPFAAVERVEVLKDGASAIYGTDAIGGVINFILRTDYTGLEASASGDVTQHGGGNVYTTSLLWGKGTLDKDGYNVLVSLAGDETTLLNGHQRSFQNGYQPARGLAPDTTGTPFANQVITYNLPNDPTTYNRANLLSFQGNCQSIPGQVQYAAALWGNSNYGNACAYDYGADMALMQPVKHLNLVSRGTLKLDEATTAFIEVTASQTRATDYYTPQQLNNYDGFEYPAGGPYYQDLSAYVPGFDPTQPIGVRWRCVACGDRSERTTTTTYRVLAGLEGDFKGWDYQAGISAAGSRANTDLTSGYFNTDKMVAAFQTGLINPWLLPGQQQTSQAMALIHGAEVTGPVYNGSSRMLEADASASGVIAKLPAGPLAMAVGVDLRRETYDFGSNGFALNDVLNATSDPSLPQASRNIYAVYSELSVPIVKHLDAQLAVRHDQYSDFGGTTNPKVGLRFQPLESLLMRGSWSTGFHAPDFEQLYAGQTPSSLNNPAPDPVLCPQHPGDPNYCDQNWNYQTGGNPKLKPEKSQQVSAGVVVSPLQGLTASLDWWKIRRTNKITTPDPSELLADFPQYVVRNADGTINYIQDFYTNIASDVTSGVDVSLNWSRKIGADQLSFNLDGTYSISHRTRQSAADPSTEFVGQFGDPSDGYDSLYQRWRHAASVTWSHDVWATTLSQQFSSGYKDEVPEGVVPPGFDPNVHSYTLYNLGVTYSGVKNASFTFTVKNLFDTAPPFSAHNVDDVGGAGWDSRVGQPRMRSFMLAARYKFW